MEKIIVIREVTVDTFGNTLITDIEGKLHKIGVKRAPDVHELVRKSAGLAVKLTYANFMNKDYIDNVELAGDLVQEAARAGATGGEEVRPTQPPKPRSSGSYKADPDKMASIEKQVSLKEAVNLCIGGKIELVDISKYAKKFADWLSNENS